MTFITLMKFLATLLVINSHCDEILPISAFATGGSLGDSLFFIASGFCLYTSVDKNFLGYIKRRILRIYPSVLIVTATLLILGKISIEENVRDVFKLFIFPTRYNFLTAMIAFYFLYWVLLHGRKNKTAVITVVMSVAFVVYAVTYFFLVDLSRWSIESAPYKYLYWLLMFLLGGGYTCTICTSREVCVTHKKHNFDRLVDSIFCSVFRSENHLE